MASEASSASDTQQRIGRANLELAQELAEAHRREAATAEVLKAINRSTFNLQDVLDSLVRSAVQLTGAETGLIFRQDGEVYRAAAIYDPDPKRAEAAKQNPVPKGRQSATGRAVLERRVVHIHDVLDDPEYSWAGRQTAGNRTLLAVPMLRDDIVVGVIVCVNHEVRPFTAKQIELVQTFADQAVIAIENARFFEAEQTSKRELTEALESQTAISEVLSIIGRSKFDLQPVLDALIESAAKLCEADQGGMVRMQGSSYVTVANYGHSLQLVRFLRASPFDVGRGTISGRVILEGRTIQVGDVLNEPELDITRYRVAGTRTILGVPLLREGAPIGVFVLSRRTVRPFTDKQIELVSTFADQAVIAIENTRLFEAEQASKRELTEALEQQTATADVLKVISRSALDVQKVLDAL